MPALDPGLLPGVFRFQGHDCRLCHPPGKEEGQTQRKVAGLFCRTFAAARGTPGGKSPCPGCFTCKTAGRACPDFAVGISPVPNGKGVGEWPAGKWTEPKNDNQARKPKRKALSTGKTADSAFLGVPERIRTSGPALRSTAYHFVNCSYHIFPCCFFANCAAWR